MAAESEAFSVVTSVATAGEAGATEAGVVAAGAATAGAAEATGAGVVAAEVATAGEAGAAGAEEAEETKIVSAADTFAFAARSRLSFLHCKVANCAAVGRPANFLKKSQDVTERAIIKRMQTGKIRPAIYLFNVE